MSLKCLKVLEIQSVLFQCLEILEKQYFSGKILEFMLFLKSYKILKSSDKISVDQFYHICIIFALLYQKFNVNIIEWSQKKIIWYCKVLDMSLNFMSS